VSRGRDGEETSTAAKERIVSLNETGANGDLTVIGRGTTIRGEVDFEHGARILGTFEGKIRSRGEVQIGDTADCRAEIDAERVTVEGAMQGNIIARDRLRLTKTARLNGDIRATKLLVEEGASYVGQCRVGDAAMEGGPARTTPQQAPPASPLRAMPPETVDFKPPWRDQPELNVTIAKKDSPLVTRVSEGVA
jgi:cytoskeletal protein CcmA (bactofilin family)